MHVTWERGRWRWEKWEIEPVRISLTTLFRHSCHVLIQLSKLLTLQLATIILKFLARAFHMARTPCANVWIFMSLNLLSCESIRFFRLQFLVSPAKATTRNTSAVHRLRIHQQRLRISHSIIQSAAGFIYTLEDSAFSLSKWDLAACFTPRGHGTHIN